MLDLIKNLIKFEYEILVFGLFLGIIYFFIRFVSKISSHFHYIPPNK